MDGITGLRIYFIGAHATGKTTLARSSSKRLGLPLITEVARAVLAELELDLATLRTDLDTVTAYQREVMYRQIAAEQSYPEGFVSDRAFDNLAYAAHHTLSTREFMETEIFRDYIETLRDGIIFFVRPHRELLTSDLVRTDIAWEEVVVIDGMVKFMLEMFELPYIPMACMSMQERIRMVDTTVGYVLREPGAMKGRRGSRRRARRRSSGVESSGSKHPR